MLAVHCRQPGVIAKIHLPVPGLEIQPLKDSRCRNIEPGKIVQLAVVRLPTERARREFDTDARYSLGSSSRGKELD
jgi:hypothetical protein